MVARISEAKPFRIIGKGQDKGLPPRQPHKYIGRRQLTAGLELQLQGGIHADALDGSMD